MGAAQRGKITAFSPTSCRHGLAQSLCGEHPSFACTALVQARSYPTGPERAWNATGCVAGLAGVVSRFHTAPPRRVALVPVGEARGKQGGRAALGARWREQAGTAGCAAACLSAPIAIAPTPEA